MPVVLSTDTLFTVTDVAAAARIPRALHPDGDRFIFPVSPGAESSDFQGAEERPACLILVQNLFEELSRLAPN